ncbi:hypothetical protein, variant [Loa loa]|uniref:Uncharacterized protein n=1 Tax=Loa loa TaxID=7209 RepID=A0A1S0UIH6_LOALO|nr:hypothetical protein, variant [Loa loa]EJD74624.1 hypothetical protein, variant [Loa loa]
MYKGLENQFAKSRSRYQFNIDRIAEKYCNASNKRELALETLQRDFGNSYISSPVVELEDESNIAICERLNEDFEMEYGKRICLDGGGNVRQCVPASGGEHKNCSSNMMWGEQFAAVGKYNSDCITLRANIANMLTNSVEEESYETETKRLRGGGPINNRIIDVITSPIKEGPVETHMNNHLTIPTLKNNALNPRRLQSSSDKDRFNLANNGNS